MCLHIQVRKLSLLGIAVAGAYCCMGLRSVSIEPRSCLLLRSEPSIVSFNWQGSLVIRLVAIVSIDGLSQKNRIALIGKNRSCPQFLLLHYCLFVIPQSDMNFWFFLDLKGSGSKPNGSTPQIANSEHRSQTMNSKHKFQWQNFISRDPMFQQGALGFHHLLGWMQLWFPATLHKSHLTRRESSNWTGGAGAHGSFQCIREKDRMWLKEVTRMNHTACSLYLRVLVFICSR